MPATKYVKSEDPSVLSIEWQTTWGALYESREIALFWWCFMSIRRTDKPELKDVVNLHVHNLDIHRSRTYNIEIKWTHRLLYYLYTHRHMYKKSFSLHTIWLYTWYIIIYNSYYSYLVEISLTKKITGFHLVPASVLNRHSNINFKTSSWGSIEDLPSSQSALSSCNPHISSLCRNQSLESLTLSTFLYPVFHIPFLLYFLPIATVV